MTVLPCLTHETLKELGVVSVGHRVKLLEAIAALRGEASVQIPSPRNGGVAAFGKGYNEDPQ